MPPDIITSVKIDGYEVGKGDVAEVSWAKKHYIELMYDCAPPQQNILLGQAECLVDFEVKIGEKKLTTSKVRIPQTGGGYPVHIVVNYELPPGTYPVTINAYAYKWYPWGFSEEKVPTDSFDFYITVVKEENQTSPYENPVYRPNYFKMVMDAVGKYWWVAIPVGLIILLKPRRTDLEELKELMKLKLLKEVAEE